MTDPELRKFRLRRLIRFNLRKTTAQTAPPRSVKRTGIDPFFYILGALLVGYFAVIWTWPQLGGKSTAETMFNIKAAAASAAGDNVAAYHLRRKANYYTYKLYSDPQECEEP